MTLAAADLGASRIALVGYGEVGRNFSAALKAAGIGTVAAYDLLATDPAWMSDATANGHRTGVVVTTGMSEAVGASDLVISAVTAASTETAARQIAQACGRGTFVLDLNSASPRTKKACAEVVNAAGGRYVEAAVMTSVPPHGLRTPMLLGGPHAEALLPTLARLGFAAEMGDREYGVVSAIKLCRSVMIKGMEALAIESLLAARRYGVEEEVLSSLVETFPAMDWPRQADYFWRRVFQHGKRRAEEMREAAVAVEDAALTPRMASATADVQAWIAKLRSEGTFDGLAKDSPWRDLADRIGPGR